jgi:cell division protein FtsW
MPRTPPNPQPPAPVMPPVTTHPDTVLLVAALLLTLLGLAMVFCASNIVAQAQYQDPYFFLKRQSIHALLGVALLLWVSQINYQRYNSPWVWALLLVVLAVLILVLIPGVGGRIRGSARWLRLGFFNLQPSEFAKIALIMFLAYSLAKKREKMKVFTIGYAFHMAVAGVFILLILMEPDFGTAATLAAIVVTMLLVGGTRITYVLVTIVVGGAGAVIMVLRDPKKWARVASFWDPWKYGQDWGYQLKHSLLAIGSGGVTGLGPGHSRAKLFYLPDAHTDFVFAILSEEWGFIGVCLVMFLFALLIYRGLRISLRAVDTFGMYLGLGLTLLLGFQAVINLGVVSGSLPTKGLSLPFFSYGGSSLIISLLAVGILMNISTHLRQRPGLAPGEADKDGNA